MTVCIKYIKISSLSFFILIAILSCKKQSTAKLLNVTGKLKIITVYDSMSSQIIQSYEFLYDNNNFLYQVKDPNSSTIFFNLSVDVDSNLLIQSPTGYNNYKVYCHSKKIDSITTDRPPLYNLAFNHFAIDTSIGLGEYMEAEYFGIYNLTKNDSGYTQSTIFYIPDTHPYPLDGVNNYSYTSYLNPGNIPMQFPYDGFASVQGYTLIGVNLDVPSALYLAGINGYYGFTSNKYLIKDVNGYPYRYIFNSNQQVIEMTNDVLDNVFGHGRIEFEYY